LFQARGILEAVDKKFVENLNAMLVVDRPVYQLAYSHTPMLELITSEPLASTKSIFETEVVTIFEETLDRGQVEYVKKRGKKHPVYSGQSLVRCDA
jgi:hypothetical protein